MKVQASDILSFWFEELSFAQWWKTDPELDALIGQRFADVHAAAAKCELSSWRETPEGRLAEIIVLDQFSRNLFRDDARSFAQDPLALGLAQEAIRVGADKALETIKASFMYMPYMHSESLSVHEQAVALFSVEGLEKSLESLQSHTKVLRDHGRYPQRNEVLGRTSTPEELEFLQGGRGF